MYISVYVLWCLIYIMEFFIIKKLYVINNTKEEDYKENDTSSKIDMIERYLQPVIDNKSLYKKTYIRNISKGDKGSLKNK